MHSLASSREVHLSVYYKEGKYIIGKGHSGLTQSSILQPACDLPRGIEDGWSHLTAST